MSAAGLVLAEAGRQLLECSGSVGLEVRLLDVDETVFDRRSGGVHVVAPLPEPGYRPTQVVEVENTNNVAVLLDSWLILPGRDASRSADIRLRDRVTTRVRHMNLPLDQPIREFSRTVRP